MTPDEAREVGKALTARDEAARDLVHLSFVLPRPGQRREIERLRQAGESYVVAEARLRDLVGRHCPPSSERGVAD